MNKELIAKQKKFLGLFFGSWALIVINWQVLWEIEYYLANFSTGYEMERGALIICIFALTIFQLWVIYKYILKK
ncbi:MAG: hypothetical protein HN782_08715 [Candidatus Marinimicrobia bacterium]|nr:hypothetical protein [Candidatus Neomarinimicrobiota bacterium]